MRRYEPLESTELTSMVDIIFQLMIFFLVTISVLPSVESAPQVEGNMSLATPSQGNSEVSHLVQIMKVPFTVDTYGYLVLDGTPQSAEFYTELDARRHLLNNPKLMNSMIISATNRGLWFNENSLKHKFDEASRLQDVKIIISAARGTPYGEVVKVHSILYDLRISKIAWLDRSLSEINADIKEVR